MFTMNYSNTSNANKLIKQDLHDYYTVFIVYISNITFRVESLNGAAKSVN